MLAVIVALIVVLTVVLDQHDASHNRVPAVATTVRQGPTVTAVFTIPMPNFVGHDLSDNSVQQALAVDRLQVTLRPSADAAGYVAGQNPAPGVPINPGAAVTLIITPYTPATSS
jgi:beta-lactam-binding protein with PASTA domain